MSASCCPASASACVLPAAQPAHLHVCFLLPSFMPAHALQAKWACEWEGQQLAAASLWHVCGRGSNWQQHLPGMPLLMLLPLLLPLQQPQPLPWCCPSCTDPARPATATATATAMLLPWCCPTYLACPAQILPGLHHPGGVPLGGGTRPPVQGHAGRIRPLPPHPCPCWLLPPQFHLTSCPRWAAWGCPGAHPRCRQPGSAPTQAELAARPNAGGAPELTWEGMPGEGVGVVRNNVPPPHPRQGR